MRSQLLVAVVMEALDGGLLDRAVRLLDLTVSRSDRLSGQQSTGLLSDPPNSRMPCLCQPVLDPMLAAHAAKDVLEGGRVAAPACEL